MRFPIALRALAAATVSGIATAQMMPPPGGMGMGALIRADANHDGVTTREEAAVSADATFDRLDANHDGTVTPDEMAAARPVRAGGGALPPPPQGEAGRQIPLTGTAPPPPPHAPRSMTRQQWRDRTFAQFDRIDANRDGRLDQAEMQAWRDAMRARRQERRDGASPPPPPPPLSPSPGD